MVPLNWNRKKKRKINQLFYLQPRVILSEVEGVRWLFISNGQHTGFDSAQPEPNFHSNKKSTYPFYPKVILSEVEGVRWLFISNGLYTGFDSAQPDPSFFILIK